MNTKSITRDVVRDLIHSVLDKNFFSYMDEVLDESTSFKDDLALDEYDKQDLILICKRRLDLRFFPDESEIAKLKTIGNAIDYLYQHAKKVNNDTIGKTNRT